MNEYDATTEDVPSLDRLSEGGEEAVHEASMQIVENIGIQIDHERARAVIEANGGRVHEDDVVTIPRGVVEERVGQAPSEFAFHARNPDNTLTVGGDGRPVRAPAYGPPNVHTFEDGRRRSRLSDYETLVKLVQTEDVVNCTGYAVCEPNDLPREAKHLEMLERSLVLTDQPVMGPTEGEEHARACMEMVGIAVGDPDLREPYVAGLVNTVPPRSIPTEALGALLTYAEHGQPLVVSSFTMAGASAPATLAASMALANAENLVAITLAQCVNPGTPVVYGVPSSNVDSRYGSLSVGSPESALFAAFAGQMGRYYGVPSRGGGGLTDSKTVDYQAGFESMLVQAVAAFSDVDYVLHSAGILESYATVSPEKFVLDCETLRYLDRFQRGYALGEEAFALDRVREVQPAGHFVDERSAHSGEEFYRPEAVDKRSHDDWEADGRKSSFEMARDRVRSRLDAYERPPIDEGVERRLRAYVETNGPSTF